MIPPTNGLFGEEEIRTIVRAEVAAYHRDDAIHGIIKAGIAVLFFIIGAAIFTKVWGVI